MEDNGFVQIYLTSKGTYTWSIKLPLTPGQDMGAFTKNMAMIDNKLKETFPNHAKFTTGVGRISSREMDPFD